MQDSLCNIVTDIVGMPVVTGPLYSLYSLSDVSVNWTMITRHTRSGVSREHV